MDFTFSLVRLLLYLYNYYKLVISLPAVKDEEYKVAIDISNLPIIILRTKRKTLAIELKDDGLLVRAPKRMSNWDIKDFILSKKDWIERHQKNINERRELQKQYQPYTEEELKELAKKAKEIIPAKVRRYAEIVGVSYGRITIRCQTTRWGSCSSKGNLNFNCLLMELPDEVIDSVIVHELCHRKHMNHSKAFYDEVESVFPEYKKCRNWLKENGHMYLSRLP